MKVYKYAVPIADQFTLKLPEGAEILSVHAQQNTPYFWALVEPTALLEKRHFRLAGTEHPIEESREQLKFIGTVHLHDGALVFHLFECQKP
jgi:hypothetical protein